MRAPQVFLLGMIIGIGVGCSPVNRVVPIQAPVEALEIAVSQADESPIFQDGKLIQDDWWLIFKDYQLGEFVQKAFSKNPTLEAAKTQILVAASNADRIRSSLYPYLSWGADVSRQKLSETGVIPFPTNPSGPPIVVPVTPSSSSPIPVYFSLYETEFNLTYEFDFWSKNRNNLYAALGQVQANIAEEAFVRLQLGVAVADAYFKLQTNYKREGIAKQLVDNKRQYLNIIQARMDSNIDNMLAIQTAESNLNDAGQLLLQIQSDVVVNRYQLMAYIAGSFDEEVAMSDVVDQPLPSIALPKDLSLNLVGRRPDIIAQRWMIESAGRQIEVAKAGFYPDFNLTALFGFQTIHLAELFKWPSSYFNVDPAVSLPIFDAGRLAANLRKSEFDYDLAILEYNDLVLQAAKEVLSAIEVLQLRARSVAEFKRKYEIQSEFYRLTNLRVSHSLGSNLDELVSQENMLKAQDQEVVAQGIALQAILELIKSLGGGYENCEG